MENIKNEKDRDFFLKEIKDLNIIHTTWKDYALMLLNSTPDPLRSVWREKVVTSLTHWKFSNGSISEGNVAGCEVLSELPDTFTKMVVDDAFYKGVWKKLGRLSGSKRMKVYLGNYPQESISNEANLCLKYIIKHWDEDFEDGMKYKDLIEASPLLSRMWDFAQKSQGKCVLPDEVCTYILEKPVDDSKYGVWIDVSEDIFTNGIPSEKFKDYWKSDKIEGFPFEVESDIEMQKKYFLSMCDIILKEDVSMSPCWKKICICILKNDTSMKYAGFGATLRERQAREDAIAAFSTKEEEKKKAKLEAEKLAAKIEKENKEKNK